MPTIPSVQLDYIILCLEMCVVLLALVSLVPIFLWWRSHKRSLSWFYLLAGALGFFVSARVLELGLHMVCIVTDNPVSRFINGHTWAYVLYGITAAGVFEEVGRWVVLGRLMKKNKTPQNAVLYGLGHGSMEIWAVVLASVVLPLLFVGLSIQSQGLEAALASLGVTPELEESFLPTLNMLYSYGSDSVFLTVLERALCMALHTALTIILFYGVWTHDRRYLLYAVLAHMAADLAAALQQRGVGTPLLAELWLFVWTAALSVWAVKLYRHMKKGALLC